MVVFDDIVADVATQLRRRLPDAQAYIDRVKEVATQLQTAKPMELAISNMARRVLHIIREEATDRVAREPQPQQQSEQVEEQNSAPEVKGMLAMALRPQCRNMTLANLLDSTHLGSTAASPESAGSPAPPAAPPAARPASVTDVLSDGHTDTGEGGPLEGGKKRNRNRPVWDKRQEVIEALNELITELDFMEGNIAEQAVEHIHANEVILTLGWDNTVALFLKQAAKKRKFQVVVAEAARDFGGHRLARELADAGLQVTVIADAAVFAMMARINKVLVGAHALLANGSIMGGSGLGVAAMAAKRHAVPFVVLAGLYKLSPLFPHQPDVAFNDFTSPAETMDPEIPGLALEGDVGPGGRSSYVHVPTPVLDYVPPEMISLFVTDTGGYTPSYVYRLLAEFYSRDDYILSKELLNHITRS